MIKALIFDLDGTLLNTLEDLKDSTNYALRYFGYPERSLEEVRCFVGNGVAKLIERAIPDGVENPDFQDCLKLFRENYSQNMYNHTAPYQGVMELLANLREKGYKIAVVSNKFDAAVKELCDKYFTNLIDVAIGQMDDVPKKPAPNGVYKAIQELAVDRKNCVYIGDSEVDVKTAYNASLPCIGVLWGFRDETVLKNEGCEMIVNSTDAIIKLVEEL